MGAPGLSLESLMQMLASQQGQQPNQQMSQQGQFNPANVQAQAGPQPFSFAPVPGGIGVNLLNALANAGKAATYVAEGPQERERDDARAQQLWETKQKMAMAAGEFGQREQDRKAAAATQQAEFGQREKDRGTQLDISKQASQTAQAKLDEEKRHNQATEGKPLKPDSPEQQFIDWYMQSHPGKNVGDAVTAYAKAHEKPGADSGTWQLTEDSQGNPTLFNSKTGQTKAAPDVHKAGTYAKGQGASEDALNYATTYEKAPPTGPGDYALMMKFVEMTKPSSGFRFTMAEKQMIEQSRSWMQSAEGQAYHAKNGTWFTPEQRSQMIDTMRAVSQAKGGSRGSSQPAPQAGPKVGVVEDGYRFNGGDPSNPKSWTKQ